MQTAATLALNYGLRDDILHVGIPQRWQLLLVRHRFRHV